MRVVLVAAAAALPNDQFRIERQALRKVHIFSHSREWLSQPGVSIKPICADLVTIRISVPSVETRRPALPNIDHSMSNAV